MEESLLKISNGPGIYNLNNSYENYDKKFPISPTIISQKGGISTNISLVDIDSELMGLTRQMSHDPQMKYNPTKSINVEYEKLNNGLFESENTRLTNPTIDLKGMAKNRFDFIPLNPILNSIEPFERNGDNTYLSLIDNYQECPQHKLSN